MAKREIWHPPLYSKTQHRAIQALARYAQQADSPPDDPGMALPPPTPHEVRTALDWIVRDACGAYEEQFTPGQPDVRDYTLGRRSVGLAIIKLINTKVELQNE